jgi:hypothetical protein
MIERASCSLFLTQVWNASHSVAHAHTSRHLGNRSMHFSLDTHVKCLVLREMNKAVEGEFLDLNGLISPMSYCFHCSSLRLSLRCTTCTLKSCWRAGWTIRITCTKVHSAFILRVWQRSSLITSTEHIIQRSVLAKFWQTTLYLCSFDQLQNLSDPSPHFFLHLPIFNGVSPISRYEGTSSEVKGKMPFYKRMKPEVPRFVIWIHMSIRPIYTLLKENKRRWRGGTRVKEVPTELWCPGEGEAKLKGLEKCWYFGFSYVELLSFFEQSSINRRIKNSRRRLLKQ